MFSHITRLSGVGSDNCGCMACKAFETIFSPLPFFFYFLGIKSINIFGTSKYILSHPLKFFPRV